MSKRRYRLQERAESQEETRRRIVEATAKLHEEVGPRDTTISAIADKAGVQRLTVYRHFPNETELFKACSSHWLALNPLPDPLSWSRMEGLDRVRAALTNLYCYYRKTERMWTVSYRDEPDVPPLRQQMRQVRKYLNNIRDDLTDHLGSDIQATDQSRVTLGCALEFFTWRSLASQGVDEATMVNVVCGWLHGIMQRTGRSHNGTPGRHASPPAERCPPFG